MTINLTVIRYIALRHFFLEPTSMCKVMKKLTRALHNSSLERLKLVSIKSSSQELSSFMAIQNFIFF